MRQLMGSLSRGYLSAEQYKNRMTVLWTVFRVLLAIAMAVAGATAAFLSLQAGQLGLAVLCAAAALEGIYICLFAMKDCVRKMIAADAAATLQVDVSVTDHSEEILHNYRHYESTLADDPVQEGIDTDQEAPLYGMGQDFLPLGCI